MILAILLFCAFFATAKDLPDEHKCYAPSTEVPEVTACFKNVQKKLEADLKEIYQDSLTQGLSPRMRASLQKTQRLWISYREAACSGRPAFESEGFNLCIIKVTKDRITDIDKFYRLRR
jgi:uncharacterized protein YecT (DUF1311 family)